MLGEYGNIISRQTPWMAQFVRHVWKALLDAPLQSTWTASSVSCTFLLQAILRRRGSAFGCKPVRYNPSQYYPLQEYMVAAWRKPLGKFCLEPRIRAQNIVPSSHIRAVLGIAFLLLRCMVKVQVKHAQIHIYLSLSSHLLSLRTCAACAFRHICVLPKVESYSLGSRLLSSSSSICYCYQLLVLVGIISWGMQFLFVLFFHRPGSSPAIAGDKVWGHMSWTNFGPSK